MLKGVCSKCGKIVKKRDQFCFGYDCGCHNLIYKQYNQSNKMIQISNKNDKNMKFVIIKITKIF